MKRALKILGVLVGVVAVAGLAGLLWVNNTWQRDFSAIPLPDLHASADPAIIARGEYVAQHVAHCSHCHSPNAPAVGDLSGGPVIDAGPFGRFSPPNLTPDNTGIGTLSDGQLARAIRGAVDHTGRLAPLMLIAVAPMSDADLVAVLSYLRSLPKKVNTVPADEWGFVARMLSGRFLPRTGPAPDDVPATSAGVSVTRGAYLVNGPALCSRCHTARDPMQGFAFAGPLLAGDPHPHADSVDAAFEIYAPNITPGGVISGWTEEQFITRMRAGRAMPGSIMPWDSYLGLTDDDVRCIYRYLQTVPRSSQNIGATRRPKS